MLYGADQPEFSNYKITSNELITENSEPQGERQNINLRKDKILGRAKDGQ